MEKYGGPEIGQFLTDLAVLGEVTTGLEALSALLFYYGKVLGCELQLSVAYGSGVLGFTASFGYGWFGPNTSICSRLSMSACYAKGKRPRVFCYAASFVATQPNCVVLIVIQGTFLQNLADYAWTASSACMERVFLRRNESWAARRNLFCSLRTAER